MWRNSRCSSGESCCPWRRSVDVYPLITVSGVRNSWLKVANNSTSRCPVSWEVDDDARAGATVGSPAPGSLVMDPIVSPVPPDSPFPLFSEASLIRLLFPCVLSGRSGAVTQPLASLSRKPPVSITKGLAHITNASQHRQGQGLPCPCD